MDEKIRILIVAGDAASAANLFQLLGEDRYVLHVAIDGLTALHLVATNTYDAIVLDVALPDVSAFQLSQRLREDLHCNTPIVFMAARDRIDDGQTGVEQSGADYLVKPNDLGELARRIDLLHHHHRHDVNATLRAGIVSFDPGTLRVHIDGHQHLELSGTAARIFEAMMRSYPRLMTHEQLQEHLPSGDDADMNTLRTHIYVLRKQLQQVFHVSLIKTLRGRGYRLVPPGED